MVDLGEKLVELAFRSRPARDANAEIAAVRAEYEATHGRALSYEVALRPYSSSVTSAAELLHRFAHLLEAKGLKALDARWIFVPIFAEDRLHFVHGEAFLGHLLSAVGLSEADLPACAEAWRRANSPPSERAQGLALPPGSADEEG